MHFVPGHTPISLPLTTTIDIEWATSEAAERCATLVGAHRDNGQVLPLLARVFGPGTQRGPRLIGACEFGGGTNYYKSILFMFQDGPNQLSFSLHSNNIEFRDIHERELLEIFGRVRSGMVVAGRSRPRIRVETGGLTLSKVGFVDGLRREYWIIIPFLIEAIREIIRRESPDWRLGLISIAVYIIAATIVARRGSNVLTIER